MNIATERRLHRETIADLEAENARLASQVSRQAALLTRAHDLYKRLEHFRREGGALPSTVHLLMDLPTPYGEALQTPTPEPPAATQKCGKVLDSSPFAEWACAEPMPCTRHAATEEG